MDERVPIETIEESKVIKLLCWPNYSHEIAIERVKELKELGIKTFVLNGRHRVDTTTVLGKGHTGLVMMVETSTGFAAIKILRTDANRHGFDEEAELLKIANGVGIGPSISAWTRSFLLMEIIQGPYLGEWIEGLAISDAPRLQSILKDLINQARRLDKVGLDHGELVRVKRHIIIQSDKPVIIDFESASISRRPANVTTVLQSLFMNTKASTLISRVMPLPDREPLLEALKKYKREMSEENYNQLVKTTGL